MVPSPRGWSQRRWVCEAGFSPAGRTCRLIDWMGNVRGTEELTLHMLKV